MRPIRLAAMVAASALLAAAALVPATAAATPLPADTEITPADGLFWVLVPEIGDNPQLVYSPHFTMSQGAVNTRYGSHTPPKGDDKHCKPHPDYNEPLCFFGTPMDHSPTSREDYDAVAELGGWPNADFTATSKGLKVTSGAISPKFECNAMKLDPVRSPCTSKLTLKTTGKVKVPGEKKKRVVVLATTTLQPGSHPIKLNATARKLLKKYKHISARSTIVTSFEWEQVTKTAKRNIGLFMKLR